MYVSPDQAAEYRVLRPQGWTFLFDLALGWYTVRNERFITCYLECIISVKHIYLLWSNYAYSDMFRLEGAIIRLFVEPYRRYIKYSAHFGIPKKFTLNTLRTGDADLRF